MENYLYVYQIIIKVLFYLLIPAAVIFFRIKNKLKTAFALGLIFTSFILGIFGTASITENPIGKFEDLINQKKRDESKKALKIIIQYGPEYVEKIDERKIVYMDLYREIKLELIEEYNEIAQKNYREFDVDESLPCDSLFDNENSLGQLKHAMRLIGYSESIGGQHDFFKHKLNNKIEKCQEKLSIIEENCD